MNPDTLAQARQHHLAGDLHRAEALYRQVLQEGPADPDVCFVLGEVCRALGKQDQAASCYRQVVRDRPGHAAAHHHLGVVLLAQGRHAEAEASLRQALRLQPDNAQAHHHLGNLLRRLGRADEAAASYRAALRLRPDHPGAHLDLAVLLMGQGKLAEAVAGYLEALRRRPDYPEAHNNLGVAFQQSGLPAYAAAAFEQALRHRPDFAEARHNSRAGALTRRVRGSADRWVSLVGLSDAQAAERIGADGIDILVNLAGHTGSNRLAAFARKPAPVQASLFGYMASTGLAAVDYRITDAHADPPGLTERYHSEELVRLPDALWCYRPATRAEVGSPPAVRSGRVTFGSFNSLAKVSAPAVALWAEVLNAVPGSRMVVLAGAGRAGDGRVLEAFALHGVGGGRVSLVGHRGREDYFKLYRGVDVCLDTFPYTGCNTTCDALWMGVPVVTLAGRTCMSRQGVAPLALAGLHDLVADTPAAYVAAAARLAGDPGALRDLRSGLRGLLARSPLLDVARYVRGLEGAYRRMWQAWCAGDRGGRRQSG